MFEDQCPCYAVTFFHESNSDVNSQPVDFYFLSSLAGANLGSVLHYWIDVGGLNACVQEIVGYIDRLHAL